MIKCSRCNKPLNWADEMANMAVKHGENDICKDCRRIQTLNNLRSVRLALL